MLWRRRFHGREPWPGEYCNQAHCLIKIEAFHLVENFQKQVDQPCFWCQMMNQRWLEWKNSWDFPGNNVSLKIPELSHFSRRVNDWVWSSSLYMFTFMFNFEIKTNKKQKAVKPPLQILGNVKLQVLMFKCEKQPLKDQLYQLPYIS